MPTNDAPIEPQDSLGSLSGKKKPLIPRTLMALFGIALLFASVYALRGVLTPICTALGIAYLLDPVVDRFEARRIPRGPAIVIVLTILTVLVGLFFLLVLPGVVREVAQFLSDLPSELADVVRQIEPILQQYDIPVPHSIAEALTQFEIAPGDLASHAAQPVQAVLQLVLGGTVSVVGALASLLIVPVLAFYLLYDFDRMTAGARELVPLRVRDQVVEVATEIDAMLGQFVRGQLLVMIAMAMLYGVAYSLVGVRLAVPIALVAGLLAFIPYVGSGSALTMGLLMCVVDWTGWTKVILVVVAYGVCQFLEGFVIIPRVVGNKVGLPAVWVLVALMIGGEVFGFLGVLLAVPVAAVAKIFVVRALAWYKTSHYYLGEEAPTAAEAREDVATFETHVGTASEPPLREAEAPTSATSEAVMRDAVVSDSPSAPAPEPASPSDEPADA
jgi:predicted PurR-regulated permease PerM